LQQCGLTSGKVLSVNGDSKVLDALISMSNNSVSSLAVLDDQGMLLGNISMTDIKHIMKSLRTSWLWISCFQLVCKIRLSHGIESGEDQYPILDVNAKSTFGYTLSKLQATKAHRMWVEEEEEEEEEEEDILKEEELECDTTTLQYARRAESMDDSPSDMQKH
ncbi:cell separation during budding, partial [Podila epicladia]